LNAVVEILEGVRSGKLPASKLEKAIKFTERLK
jgi:hypothetical protein